MALTSGTWLVRLRHPTYILRRSFLQHTGAGQQNLEVDLWKLVDGFDRLRPHRAPGECSHRTESLRWFLVRSLQRTASESGFRSAALDCRPERSRRKKNQ